MIFYLNIKSPVGKERFCNEKKKSFPVLLTNKVLISEFECSMMPMRFALMRWGVSLCSSPHFNPWASVYMTI